MDKRNKVLVWGAGILATLIILISVTVTVSNGQIKRQQEVQTARANISKEEERRIDLFNNLADAVQSYNKYEDKTMNKIVKARAKANDGKINAASKELNVVVERYPNLKSQSNYKQAMMEFSITENRLANYRENYNDSVQDYNYYVQRFPNKQILEATGHNIKTYPRLNYNVDNAKATNLFDK